MKPSPPEWAIALFFILAGPAFSKCGIEIYTVRGAIQECSSKNAVKNAKVFVFVNDEIAQIRPWPEHGLELPHPQSPETSTDGQFVASYLFSTWKGYSFLLGENCTDRPRKVTLYVIADRYRPKRKVHKKFTVTEENGMKVVSLPATCLPDRDHRTECGCCTVGK
jgi:hypothetical protein